MEVAKKGDIIEWSFSKNDKINEKFAGKTFQGEVAMVDFYDKCYGVWIDIKKYPEYKNILQDLIPFKEATIIKKPSEGP